MDQQTQSIQQSLNEEDSLSYYARHRPSSSMSKYQQRSPMNHIDLQNDFYQNAISDQLSKLKIQEQHYSKIIDALKCQVQSLRAQLELNQNLHEREVQRLKEQHQQKLIEGENDQNKILFQMNSTYEEARKQLFDQKNKTQDLRFQIKQLSNQSQENYLSKARNIESLQQKQDFYKQQYLNVGKAEVSRLHQELIDMKQEYENIVQNLKEQHKLRMNELREKSEQRQNLLQEMQRQFEQLQDQKSNIKTQFSLELEQQKEKVQSLRKNLTVQEVDMSRLRRSIHDYIKENKVLQKEQVFMQNEIDRLKREQDDLLGEKSRLERLVYGKKI